MTNSIYKIQSFLFIPGPIFAGDKLLPEDIPIPASFVSPGGGGLMRLYFALFVENFVPTEVGILDREGFIKGILNGDNNNIINDEGYYRFDIDLEEGDQFNLVASVNIELVGFFRAHLITFGA